MILSSARTSNSDCRLLRDPLRYQVSTQATCRNISAFYFVTTGGRILISHFQDRVIFVNFGIMDERENTGETFWGLVQTPITRFLGFTSARFVVGIPNVLGTITMLTVIPDPRPRNFGCPGAPEGGSSRLRCSLSWASSSNFLKLNPVNDDGILHA